MTDQDIFDRWQGEDAPLLPVLQAFHNRDEHISEDAIKSISTALKIPLAELFATVTFYHHFPASCPAKVLHVSAREMFAL